MSKVPKPAVVIYSSNQLLLTENHLMILTEIKIQERYTQNKVQLNKPKQLNIHNKTSDSDLV